MLPPTNNYQPSPKRHGLRTLILLIVLLAVIGGLASQRQQLYDDWQLRGYQAPSAVADLATQDTMTTYARRIYYVNHPNITTGTDFTTACPNNGGEKTIVLGCYKSGQRGITLLSVTDPLLNGVEQVTAAHEMLHSAYERLSSSQKAKVNAMLEDYYQHDLHDQRMLTIMSAYKQTEPNDLVNEMHSVFGTEIANLPQPLEQYYQKYFSNRAQVVAFANKYQSEFTSRQNLIATYSAQLADLKAQIDSTEADLNSKLKDINSSQTRMAILRESDTQAYNSAVPAYNQAVDSYNAEVKSLQNTINRYNDLVMKMNAVVVEEDQLVKELSTSSTPISN